MPVMLGMFQSERTRSGFSDDDLGQRVGAVLGLDDVVVVVTGLAQGADDDLPHDAAVVGDQDLHSGTSFFCWFVTGRSGAPAEPCTEMVRDWPRHRSVDAADVVGAGGGGGPDLGQAEDGRAGEDGLDVAAHDVGELTEGVGDVLVVEHRRSVLARAGSGPAPRRSTGRW